MGRVPWNRWPFFRRLVLAVQDFVQNLLYPPKG